MKQAMPSSRASPRKNGHLDNFGAFRSFMDARCRTKPLELQEQECGSASRTRTAHPIAGQGCNRTANRPGSRSAELDAAPELATEAPFYSTLRARQPKQWGVRTCVIFNPAARGDKARRFRRHLDDIGRESTLKHTAAVGDARRLAAEAVSEGFDSIVAAGGDGTLNEVVNGMGDVPDGFERARLGVLPLGTVNVFARELAIPTKLETAWAAIRQGRETRIDLPRADYHADGTPGRRYFAQMAGAGLDARAVEQVQWQLKKRIGQLAYVVAGRAVGM